MDETQGPEEQITLSPEEQIQQLRDYAATQADHGFVWVYRGETVIPDRSQIAPLQTSKAGTWFTTSFGAAQEYARDLGNRGKQSHVIAIAVPKSLIDEQEQAKRIKEGGSHAVRVHFREELIEKVVDGAMEIEPDAEMYVKQFKIASTSSSATSGVV